MHAPQPPATLFYLRVRQLASQPDFASNEAVSTPHSYNLDSSPNPSILYPEKSNLAILLPVDSKSRSVTYHVGPIKRSWPCLRRI